MCKALKVSRSGYYGSSSRTMSKRKEKDLKILDSITSIHKKHPSFGVKPMHSRVKKEVQCSHETVRRIMKANDIRSKRKDKWIATTNSSHKLPVAQNLLNRNFNVDTPNKIWVGDITYNWTDEGWLYTAIVKDLCTKDVVGYAFSDRIDKELVIAAMKMAIKSEKPSKGLVFHSDRGSQYCSKAYQDLLKGNNIVPSMSRAGNPYDNAVSENFFSCMKNEKTHLERYKTRWHARNAIFEYIAIFYNRQRPHSKLGYLTPIEYKELYYAQLVA